MNMSKLILLTLFCLALLFSSKSQLSVSNSSCKLTGNQFYSNCEFYRGYCFDGKANGWGSLYLKNGDGIYSGYFIDNKLIDFNLEYYQPKDSTFIFGPNINGAIFNGPCTRVNTSRFDVSHCSYQNGQYVSNSQSYFKIEEPKLLMNQTFCGKNTYSAQIGGVFIPEKRQLVYIDQLEIGSKTFFWVSLVSLETNTVIFNYGNSAKPLKVQTYNGDMSCLGLSDDKRFAYFKLGTGFYECDLLNGKYSILTSYPTQITKQRLASNKIQESSVVDFNQVANYKILDDSSYVKAFNSVKKNSSLIVHFDKQHNVINKLEIKQSQISAMDVSKVSNKIVLVHSNTDSTYLSLHNLETLAKVKDVFQFKNNSKKGSQGNILFSNTGIFVIYSWKNYLNYNFIFKDDQLYFGIDGDILGFNPDDNVVLVQDRYGLVAYDLNKKIPIYQYACDDQAGCYFVDNDIYVLSRHDENKLFKIKFPEPLSSMKSFALSDRVLELINQEVEKKKQPAKIVENEGTNKDQILFSESNPTSTNDVNEIKYIIKIYRINNTGGTKCQWCSKQLYCTKKSEVELKNEVKMLNSVFGKLIIELDRLMAAFEGRIVDNGDGTKTHKIPQYLYDCPKFCSLKCKYEFEQSGY